MDLREDADGVVQVVPLGVASPEPAAFEASCRSALDDHLEGLLAQRSTAATGVHDASSRSHLIVELRLPSSGAITLVDLAGGEWARDQRAHGAERVEEAKEINSSLMTLKQCLNGRLAWERGGPDSGPEPAVAGAPLRLPVRESKLTRLLQRSVFDPETEAVLIATVSPGAAEVEHAIDTLQHCCLNGGDSHVASTTLVPGLANLRADAPSEAPSPAPEDLGNFLKIHVL